MAERSATWLIGSEPEARPFGQGGQVGRAREEPRLENLDTILVDIHQVINSHKIQRSSEKNSEKFREIKCREIEEIRNLCKTGAFS